MNNNVHIYLEKMTYVYRNTPPPPPNCHCTKQAKQRVYMEKLATRSLECTQIWTFNGRNSSKSN